MKIAVDPWTLASRFRYHGTYVYARNLLSEFKRLVSADSGLEFCVFAPGNGGNDAASLQSGPNFEIERSRLVSLDRVWRVGGAGFAARRAHADVIFCPTTSTLPVGTVPVVCTIHDATAVTMPSHSQRVTLLLRSLLWWVAKFTKTVITVSEYSKKDLMELYGLPDSKVAVIYHGYDKSRFNTDPINHEQRRAMLNRLGIGRPYIVHHGTIQPRKNLERLIRAYRLLLSRNTNLEVDLVLAGDRGWECAQIYASAGSPGRGRVHLPGALSDTELAILIKSAALAVIPSLYEGFCLPMIECMACGTPTIASNTSCLPEISGGRLIYFDPLSLEDMADCMERALENTYIRHQLIEGGIERAAEFDWSKCARQTLDILKRGARNGHSG